MADRWCENFCPRRPVATCTGGLKPTLLAALFRPTPAPIGHLFRPQQCAIILHRRQINRIIQNRDIKMRPNCKLATLLKYIVSAANIIFIFGANSSAAQSSSEQTAIHQPPAYCQRSKLNGIELMGLIKTIIAHGDLKDIAFIEKTLGTKFTSSHGVNADGTPNNQILKLNSNTVFGNPIHVSMMIFYDKSLSQRAGELADLTFGGPPSFIADCLHVPISNTTGYFGGRYTSLPTGAWSSTSSVTRVEDYPGINATKLRLTFYHENDNDFVAAFWVYQVP